MKQLDSEDITILDLIRSRRSVFPGSFTSKPVSEEIIHSMLEAANWAPTHKRTEPWRFKVLQGEALHRFSDFLLHYYDRHATSTKPKKRAKTGAKPLQSSAVILICMDPDPKRLVPEWEEIAAVAMSVQNMWLAGHALGVGGYWSSPKSIEAIGDFLPLKDGERCLGYFYLGHHNQPLMAGVRGPWEEKVEWLRT